MRDDRAPVPTTASELPFRDRFLVSRSGYFFVLGANGLAGLLVFSLPGMFGMIGLALLGYRAWVSRQITRAFKDGDFPRALALARRAEALAQRGADPEWRIFQGYCLLCLGRRDEAKELIGAFRPEKLAPATRLRMDSQRAILFQYAALYDDCLAVLDEVKTLEGYAEVRPQLDYLAACAHLGNGNFAAAQEALTAAAAGKHLCPMGYHLGIIEALLKLERDGDASGALALFRKAQAEPRDDLKGPDYESLFGGYFELAAGGDPGHCMELVTPLLENEDRMPLPSQAMLHYVLAACQHELGFTPEGRRSLEQARSFPCASWLTTRMDHLELKLKPPLVP
jgi:tetratricopeptide (TPR) repeat protein